MLNMGWANATMADFWFWLVGSISEAVLLLAGVLGGLRYRSLPGYLRPLVGVVWFGLVMEATAKILQVCQLPNLWLGPFDATGEFALLSLLYARALGWPAFARWQPWLAVAFGGYALISLGVAPEMTRFKTGVLILEGMLLLALVGLYFRKLLNELLVPRLSADALFWVSAGLLLYSLGKMLIALFGNYVLEHYSLRLSLWVWTIHGLLSVVLYLCYLRALWLRPQK